MKPLRILALCSTGFLAVGLFVLIGCQKPAAAPTVADGPVISISEPAEAQPRLSTVKTYVGPEQMDAELCITPRQIQTGMMFRKSMGTNDGMLFNLGVPQQAGFWMKNCYVPLSVAYISPDGVIEEIHPLQVQDTNTVLSTADNIQFALETPQGWFDQHHVTTGMVIRTERGTLSETFSGNKAPLKVALAQINPTVGDLAGNEAKIRAAYQRGVDAGAEMVLCPELAITGYPPRDLLLKKSFIARNLETLDRLAASTGKVGLMLGYVGRNESQPGRELTNSVALLQNGKIITTRVKTLLPTYDVFDEDRYFEPASENLPADFNSAKVGLTICEDIWNDEDFWTIRRYQHNPPVELAEAGAKIIFNISASPWHLGKNKTRFEMLRSIAQKTRRPVVFCNQVGGNDELIFDGHSVVFNANGDLIAQGKWFEEDFIVVDTESTNVVQPVDLPAEEAIYQALTLGLRDYFYKCGFKSAVLGLSGGIDSAVTACIAVAALGKANVRGLSLPSQFSSQHSLDDAHTLAKNLDIQYDVVPIQPSFETVKHQLEPVFAGKHEDTTEENVQARLRGVILMALSNKFGSLLLTTGNKSEIAVGYCTLYGDMAGGLAVISDVPKTMIYRLAKWINREHEIIPDSSISKPPSAELRPDQCDQDSLPPYDVLDAILDLYVVNSKSASDIIAAGFDEATVRRVIRLIDFSEYKRRQAAPGLKVTTKAFGMGRRIPIAQKYWEK